MKNVLKAVGGTFSLAIGISIFALYFVGVVHSYNLHSKADFALSLVPIWGLYRGLEYFWH